MLNAVKRAGLAVSGALGALVASPVFAQATLDFSAATGYIETEGVAGITAVGIALITVAAAGLVFRWVKGMLF